MRNFKIFVGKKIQRRRAELGLNQEELAAGLKTDTDRARVSDWERGKYYPDPEHIKALKRVLKVDDIFFDLSDEDERQNSDLLLKIIRILPALDQNELMLTLELFETFSSTHSVEDEVSRKVR